jgi:hypothetical protein
MCLNLFNPRRQFVFTLKVFLLKLEAFTSNRLLVLLTYRVCTVLCTILVSKSFSFRFEYLFQLHVHLEINVKCATVGNRLPELRRNRTIGQGKPLRKWSDTNLDLYSEGLRF